MIIRYLYLFGEFKLDPTLRTCRGVRLTPHFASKEFDILHLLVRRGGHSDRPRPRGSPPDSTVVSRDEIRQACWPGVRVLGETTIPAHIKNLRRKLGQTAAGDEYIKAAASGYYISLSVSRRIKRTFAIWAGACLVLAIVASVAALNFPKIVENFDELVMNDKDGDFHSIALAPNGKRLAFADDTGVFVRDTLHTDETKRLGREQFMLPASGIAFEPDGSLLLVEARDNPSHHSALWRLSPSGAPTQLADAADVAQVAASPDRRLAWITGDRQTLMACETEATGCKEIFTVDPGNMLNGISWPDMSSIIFGSFSVCDFQLHLTIREISPDGRHSRSILSDQPVTAFSTTRDGWLLYATAEPKSQGQYDATLWKRKMYWGEEQQPLSRFSTPSSYTRSLRKWSDSIISAISASRDVSQFAILRGPYKAHVYVADIDSGTYFLQSKPQRLTTYNGNEFPTAWTEDSQRVIYHSDRFSLFSGPLRNFGLFVKGLKDSEARPLAISRSYDIRDARLSHSPTGTWVLYYKRRRQHWKTWMRMHLDGTGESKLPLDTGDYDLRCAAGPNSGCVLMNETKKSIIFSTFDVESGAQHELLAVDPSEFGHAWAVSPKGDQLAIVKHRSGRASILRYILHASGLSEELPLSATALSLDWDSTGTGWYASMPSGYGSDLVHIGFDGRQELVCRQGLNFVTWAVPSPDGKQLAILEWTGNFSTVWLLRGASSIISSWLPFLISCLAVIIWVSLFFGLTAS
jgi:DNA-binding winged helix-turn-helix (wHTH) protein